MADKWFYLILFFLLFVHSYPAGAGSVEEFVAKGNEAYEKGNYDEALAAYEKAAKESPESARVFFNLGTAYYQKGEYAKAIEVFKQAALKSKDAELEADSQYNLGNSSFRAAEQQKTGDLHQALESYGKSIEFYREALERSPDFTEAAENLEMARLVMKSIIEEIQQKEEASEKQQQARKEAVDKLEQLIERQKQLKERTGEFTDQAVQSGDTNDREKKGDALADNQKKLSQETKELAEKLPAPEHNQPPEEHPSKSHISQAADQQEMAVEKLNADQAAKAMENQQKALDELQKALDSLQDNRENDQQQEQKPDEDGKENNDQDDGEAMQGQQEEPGKESESQEQDTPEGVDAAAIIDEERENMKNRRQRSAAGYKGVERDW
ncbi:MAG: tetratricopeptide repeat protein [Desulfobacterales bacterium]